MMENKNSKIGEADLRGVVWLFINSQPEQIRNYLAYHITLSITQCSLSTQLDDCLVFIEGYLLGAQNIYAPGAVICICSLIDFLICRGTENQEKEKEITDRFVEQFPEQERVKLELPLQHKFWRRTADSWFSLRKGELSLEKILDFHQRILTEEANRLLPKGAS